MVWKQFYLTSKKIEISIDFSIKNDDGSIIEVCMIINSQSKVIMNKMLKFHFKETISSSKI